MASTKTTVAVHGPALRELRIRSGLDVQSFADAVGVKRPYVTKLELGHSRHASPKVFNAMLATLAIRDRRVLMADPYAEDVAA